MGTQGTDPMTSQAAEPPRRKPWHGILFGLGCGVLTLATSFICLFAIVVGALLAFFTANESFLTGRSNNEILQGWKWGFALILGVSIILMLIAGTLGGRAVYRQSAEPRATRRLFKAFVQACEAYRRGGE